MATMLLLIIVLYAQVVWVRDISVLFTAYTILIFVCKYIWVTEMGVVGKQLYGMGNSSL